MFQAEQFGKRTRSISKKIQHKHPLQSDMKGEAVSYLLKDTNQYGTATLPMYPSWKLQLLTRLLYFTNKIIKILGKECVMCLHFFFSHTNTSAQFLARGIA